MPNLMWKDLLNIFMAIHKLVNQSLSASYKNIILREMETYKYDYKNVSINQKNVEFDEYKNRK